MNWRSLCSFEPREFVASPSDHRPALDGVRGIAILTVFLYDCLKLPSGGIVNLLGRKLSSAGWTGVDLFFVLSGFLITGILLDSRGRPGYLRSFFARRSLRIFPLYFLALWTTFVAVPALAVYWSPAEPVARRVAQLSHDQVWFWTYLQNWMFAFRGHWPNVNYLNHFWSLAVEEQFYLVWPFVVGWCGSRALARICWAAVVGALLLRVGLWSQGAPSVALYVPTLTRVDSLCFGALFAMGLRSPIWYPRLCHLAPWMLGGLAVAIIGIDAVWPILKTEQVGSQTIGHTLLGLLFGTFVFTASAARSEGRLAQVLSLRGLTLLGQFSYCMYVLHRPVYKLVNKLDWSVVPESVRGLLIFGAALLGSLALSALSWKFIEKPILALKSWFPRPGEDQAKLPVESSPPVPAPVA
jgi:peptidoglycan/LPS O-acetylase OafA/YrhL